MDTHCVGGIAETLSNISVEWKLFFALVTLLLVFIFTERKIRENVKNKGLLVEYRYYEKIAEDLRGLRSEMMERLAVLVEIFRNDWYDQMGSGDLTRANKLNLHRWYYKNTDEQYRYKASRYNEWMKGNSFIFCDVSTLPHGATKTLPKEFNLRLIPPQYIPYTTKIPGDA